MATLRMRLDDQVAYANQWGDTKTWHGRAMYLSPEQARAFNSDGWVKFCAAIGATLADVMNNPTFHDPNGMEELQSLLWWASSHIDHAGLGEDE